MTIALDDPPSGQTSPCSIELDASAVDDPREDTFRIHESRPRPGKRKKCDDFSVIIAVYIYVMLAAVMIQLLGYTQRLGAVETERDKIRKSLRLLNITLPDEL